jgi:hypothetical protein
MDKLNTIKKTAKNHVISCRITKDHWNRFEIKCIENRVPMSKILQQAVVQYLNPKNN